MYAIPYWPVYPSSLFGLFSGPYKITAIRVEDQETRLGLKNYEKYSRNNQICDLVLKKKALASNTRCQLDVMQAGIRKHKTSTKSMWQIVGWE